MTWKGVVAALFYMAARREGLHKITKTVASLVFLPIFELGTFPITSRNRYELDVRDSNE
jgi:hypothetical protein